MTRAGRRPSLGSRSVVSPEEELQRTVVQWLRYLLRSAEQRSGQAPWMFFHPANGGGRSKAEAGIFNALGVLAGVPDLVFVLEGGRAAFIELKREGWQGQLSGNQQLVQKWCREGGVPHQVATSLEAVQAALIQWGMVEPVGSGHLAISPTTWPPSSSRAGLVALMSKAASAGYAKIWSMALSAQIMRLPLTERIRLCADLTDAHLPTFVIRILTQILEELGEVES